MNNGVHRKANLKNIALSMIVLIPVVFLLVLLAAINILLLFVAVILILLVLLLIREKNRDFFIEWFTVEAESAEAIEKSSAETPLSEVRMVLSSDNDFYARRIMVNKDRYCIGRSWDNDFKIEGKSIGRHHLEIVYNKDENVCYAEDLGSLNGTYLNDARMIVGKRYRLTQGDRLMIDDRMFTVEYAHYRNDK